MQKRWHPGHLARQRGGLASVVAVSGYSDKRGGKCDKQTFYRLRCSFVYAAFRVRISLKANGLNNCSKSNDKCETHQLVWH